ncbi:unnamed protein product [Sympodiomycopsis kandeliae]
MAPAMDPSRDFYSFVKLTDLPASLTFSARINSLQGQVLRSSLIELLEDESKKGWGINSEPYPPFYLTLRLYSANKPLTPIFRTPFRHFKKGWEWNELIDFDFPLRDLPLDAQLGITIWDTPGVKNHQDEGKGKHRQEEHSDEHNSDRVVGGTTLKLFGKKGTLKKAQHRCYIHLGKQADGSVNSETNSKGSATVLNGEDKMSEMSRLEKLIKRHERMDIPHLQWLDKQTYRVIEAIHAKETAAIKNELWLYIDLPRFEWPIVWCEEHTRTQLDKHTQPGFAPNSSTAAALSNAVNAPQTANVYAQGSISKPSSSAPLLDRTLFTLPDPESQRENPIEAKHRRLIRAQRSRRRGLSYSEEGGGGGGGVAGNLTLARNLKPDKKARDEIEDILASPPTKELTDKESDLLWTYRFYLTKNPRGLTKFLKAVSWNDRVESRAAVETVLPLWASGANSSGKEANAPSGSAPTSALGTTTSVEIGDVLELLGPSCQMMDKAVRHWAVDRLAECDNEELSLYLLQLVQALKLDQRADDEVGPTTTTTTTTTASASGSKTGRGNSSSSSKGNQKGDSSPRDEKKVSGSSDLGPLTEFLIGRALPPASAADDASFSLLVTFYWYLSVECSDDRWGLLYRRIRRRLQKGLDQSGETGQHYLSMLRRQEQMVGRLGEMARTLRSNKDARPKKIEKLKEWCRDESLFGLSPPGKLKGKEQASNTAASATKPGDVSVSQSSVRSTLDPTARASSLPLPLDPSIHAAKIAAEQCSVFKSNLFPLLIWYETDASEQYGVIFKSGDDLRQDQLVLQLFQLMDRLLLNENLDLKLTPYRVLATAPKEGMVQFVQSKTLASIVAEYSGGLTEYLRKEGETGPGKEEEKLDRFVRSCAGYCVVTYLLGVGDRHLDNLLLAPDGRFFHVDFGYILNRDPKPFPPPVKLSKEMVEGMGGPTSANYARFRQLCFTAFSILRKNANLILNLIALMQDASVGDIKIEPDKAVGKVLEKFRLDLSESDARAYFDEVLQQSSTLTVIFDRVHDMGQFFRS